MKTACDLAITAGCLAAMGNTFAAIIVWLGAAMLSWAAAKEKNKEENHERTA